MYNYFIICRMNRRRECFRNLVKCGAMNVDRWGTPAFVRYIKELKIPIDADGNYSMQFMRVRNVQAPLHDDDAANKEYVDSSLEEAKTNTYQAIYTAIQSYDEGNKTILAKLYETVNEVRERCGSTLRGHAEIQEEIKKMKESVDALLTQMENIYKKILTGFSNEPASSD